MGKARNYEVVPGCTMYAALNLISGRWKGVILYHLLNGAMQFNALKRELGDDCSQRMLIKQLRELEDDGLVRRKVFAVVPPKFEYSITKEGRTLDPILITLRDWGEGWLRRRSLKTARGERQSLVHANS